MTRVVSHLRRLDWVLVSTALLLSGVGLVSIWSSSGGAGDLTNFFKQASFLLVGLFLMVGLSFVDWRLIRNDPYLILALYGLGVVSLAGLLVFAPEIRGVQGWYRVGGLNVDPIEYMKVVLVIVMARYFSIRHVEVFRLRHILITAAYFAVPAALIFLQPDLGAAALLGFLWLVMLMVAGIRLRHFLAVLTIAVLVLALGWSFILQDYQQERLLVFLEPELDPLGAGWSQLQSRIAVGAGGLLGQGVRAGTQTQYGFLPEPHTDFIFAAIAEELGFAGALALTFLFLLLIWRILRIGIRSGTNFSRLFAAGIATVIIGEVFVNVGMNLGFLPIIGLPLPLVSYGGSGLLMTYAALGILQSIQARR